MISANPFLDVDLDDEVTTYDGRAGVVIGLDPDTRTVAFVDARSAAVVHRVVADEIATATPFGR